VTFVREPLDLCHAESHISPDIATGTSPPLGLDEVLGGQRMVGPAEGEDERVAAPFPGSRTSHFMSYMRTAVLSEQELQQHNCTLV
jgi:hypothetical protein